MRTRSWVRLLAFGLVPFTLAAACGSSVLVDGSGGGANATTSGSISGAGGTGSGTAVTTGGGGLALDAGEDAPTDAPDTCDSDVKGIFTCCDGKPCRGNCKDGICECAGIDGGCWIPLICCDGCVSPNHPGCP